MKEFASASVAEVVAEVAREGRLVRSGDVIKFWMLKFSVAADRFFSRSSRNVRAARTSERCRKISRMGLIIG